MTHNERVKFQKHHRNNVVRNDKGSEGYKATQNTLEKWAQVRLMGVSK